MYNSDINPFQKRYAKPVYQKLYANVELLLINSYRKKDINYRLEEEIKKMKMNKNDK